MACSISMSGIGSRCRSDSFLSRPVMTFPDGAPFFPPHSPPPRARAVARAGRFAPYGYATATPLLSTPAGVERGAWILFRRPGHASTTRDVAVRLGSPRPRRDGRSERLGLTTPWLAAAPASDESFIVHGRPYGRRRGHTATQPLTTTGGQKSPCPNHGGDGSLRRSLSRNPEAESRLPSLPPAGGKEGRGDDWGVVKSLARENLTTTKQKSPAGTKGRN